MPPSYMLEITPIFSDQWFGEVDENHHIKNSRWAHTLMPKQAKRNVGVQNSYGYIRSYWNNNPDPGKSYFPHHVFHLFIFLFSSFVIFIILKFLIIFSSNFPAYLATT